MKDCTIRVAPDGFELIIPSESSSGTHSVLIPNSPAGLRVLHRILTARIKSSAPTIGTSASPTRHMVEEWLRQNEPSRQAGIKGGITIPNLEDLGL